MAKPQPPVAEYRARPPRGRRLAWGGPALRQSCQPPVAEYRARPPRGRRLAWGGPALRRLFANVLMLFALVAMAKDAPPTDDAAIEARVQRITEELRCLVCQNETIAGSSASLAEDLRAQVREMVKKGESEEQIVQYMTDRYGDFVLYRPPLKGTTLLLWFGPGLLLVGGLTALILVLRHRSRLSDDRFEPDDLDVAEPGGQR
jgi:cytochrome c-type biogenesis protein CcmH